MLEIVASSDATSVCHRRHPSSPHGDLVIGDAVGESGRVNISGNILGFLFNFWAGWSSPASVARQRRPWS